MLIISNTATADTSVTCNDVISKCDKALFDKDKVLKLEDLALTQRKDQVEGLNRDLQVEKSKNEAFYRQPWFLLLLGATAGKFILSK